MHLTRGFGQLQMKVLKISEVKALSDYKFIKRILMVIGTIKNCRKVKKRRKFD